MVAELLWFNVSVAVAVRVRVPCSFLGCVFHLYVRGLVELEATVWPSIESSIDANDAPVAFADASTCIVYWPGDSELPLSGVGGTKLTVGGFVLMTFSTVTVIDVASPALPAVSVAFAEML